MTNKKSVVGPAMILAGAAAVVATSAAAPVRKAPPPRIVAATMVDADGDARADGVRLAYSRPVRHSADRDGRYPFTVAGYGIRSVGVASGKSLLIRLVERPQPDSAAGRDSLPAYAAKPVSRDSGMQAGTQLFAQFARTPSEPPPLITTARPRHSPTTTTRLVHGADGDGDGS